VVLSLTAGAGRGPKPSPQVLSALTRALRLGDDDRDMLFRLAGSVPPQAGRVPMLVRPSVLRLLDRRSDLPALVLSAKSDVLAWNHLATALFGDFSPLPPAQRNLIRQRFLGTGVGRITLSPSSDSAADCVPACGPRRPTTPRTPTSLASSPTCVPAAHGSTACGGPGAPDGCVPAASPSPTRNSAASPSTGRSVRQACNPFRAGSVLVA
jgi:hypothetical protein